MNNNIVSVICKTVSGELFDVNISEFSQNNNEKFKFLSETDKGQLSFTKYNSENSFNGNPVGLLAFDANGNIVTYPIVESKGGGKLTQQSGISVGNFNGTPYMLPLYSEGGDSIKDSTILSDGDGNYSIGGSELFWKFDVTSGSINIQRGQKEDGYRLDGKLAVSLDNNKLIIGNTTYNVVKMGTAELTQGVLNLVKGGNSNTSINWVDGAGAITDYFKPSTVGFDFKSETNAFKATLDATTFTKNNKILTDENIWTSLNLANATAGQILTFDGTNHNWMSFRIAPISLAKETLPVGDEFGFYQEQDNLRFKENNYFSINKFGDNSKVVSFGMSSNSSSAFLNVSGGGNLVLGAFNGGSIMISNFANNGGLKMVTSDNTGKLYLQEINSGVIQLPTTINSYITQVIGDATAGYKFIQNQEAIQQLSSKFWISGNGRIDGKLKLNHITEIYNFGSKIIFNNPQTSFNNALTGFEFLGNLGHVQLKLTNEGASIDGSIYSYNSSTPYYSVLINSVAGTSIFNQEVFDISTTGVSSDLYVNSYGTYIKKLDVNIVFQDPTVVGDFGGSIQQKGVLNQLIKANNSGKLIAATAVDLTNLLGSQYYIWNNDAIPQPSSNFWISENGRIDTNLTVLGRSSFGSVADDGTNKIQVYGSGRINGNLLVYGDTSRLFFTSASSGTYTSFIENKYDSANRFNINIAGIEVFGAKVLNSVGATYVSGYEGLIFATGEQIVNNSAIKVFINNVGRVMIGTTTDNTVDRLQVNGGIKQTNVTNQLIKADATGRLIAAVATDVTDLIGSVASLNYWTKTGNNLGYTLGNVGVGTLNPSVKLDVVSTTPSVVFRVNTNNGAISTSNYSEIQLSDNESVRSFWRNSRDGSGAIFFGYNDHIRFLSSGTTERVRFDLNGNIGVGIIPTYKLDVNGTTRSISLIITQRALIGTTTDDTINALQVNGSIKQTSVLSTLLKADSTGRIVAAVGNSDFQQILIGTGLLSYNGNIASYNAGTTNYVTKWSNAVGGIANSLIFDNGTTVMIGTTTDNAYKLQINGASDTAQSLYVKGRLYVSGDISGNYGVGSDRKLKTNIKSFKIGNKLDKVDVYSYIKDEKTKIGSIAQDLQKVFPELVYKQNGVLNIDLYGYSSLALKLGKENKSEIEILKERVLTLESKLAKYGITE